MVNQVTLFALSDSIPRFVGQHGANDASGTTKSIVIVEIKRNMAILANQMTKIPTHGLLADQTFNNILDKIQKSNLNFQLQVSPFSAFISLKKSIVKDRSGSFLLPPLT